MDGRHEYGVGDEIEYAVAGGLRRCVVTSRSENEKNGRPGFGGETLTAAQTWQSVWGYDAQIVRVVRRKAKGRIVAWAENDALLALYMQRAGIDPETVEIERTAHAVLARARG